MKPETFIVISPRKPSAASEAGGGPANPAHSGKMTPTVLATVHKSTTQSTADQWQSMTGALGWDSKITTRFPPLGSVRQNPSARAEMCQQMGQLMAQRSIDFSRPEFLQSWIKQNEAALEISTTDGGTHPIVPSHS